MGRWFKIPLTVPVIDHYHFLVMLGTPVYHFLVMLVTPCTKFWTFKILNLNKRENNIKKDFFYFSCSSLIAFSLWFQLFPPNKEKKRENGANQLKFKFSFVKDAIVPLVIVFEAALHCLFIGDLLPVVLFHLKKELPFSCLF